MFSRQLQAVLLDMGGVILRMAGGHGFGHSRLDFRGRQAMLDTMGREGRGLTLEDLESLVFGPWLAAYGRREETGEEADWTPHLERLRSRSRCKLTDNELLAPWFRPYGEQLVPTEDARRALQDLRSMGLRLALVSNVPLPGVLYSEVLAAHGLLDPFDSLCFSYDLGSRKPSPALLRHAMSEIGATPESTIMVGDRRERDVAAGRFAGTGTIWVRSSDNGGPEADATIDAFADLPELLKGWRR